MSLKTIFNLPLLRRNLSRIPMKVSLPLLITAPVVAVVVMLATIAFLDAESAANDFMEQNLVQIHYRIKERLDDLLNLPYQILEVDTNLISHGLLAVQNLRSWRMTLFEQARSFRGLGLSSLDWGGADGRYMGIARVSGESTYVFSISDEKTNGRLHKFFCNFNGEIEREKTAPALFDPRDKPWYLAAIRTGSAIWTESYAGEDPERPGGKLTLGYAQPVRNEENKILGVMNAEMTLDNIALFLARLSVGRTGKAFLIDRRGLLIATSTGISLKGSDNLPVRASAAADKQIAAAAKQLELEFGSYNAIEGRYQLKLAINRKPYLLMISPSQHETGLSLIIATLIPESDFLAEIKAGRNRHIQIGGLAVLVTLLFGAGVAVISIWPMMDLLAFVQRIHQGDLAHELKLEYSSEFVWLSKQLNAMAAGLRDRVRLRTSLELAQEVQQNLLPSENPVIKGLEITGCATYCDETGGDYFDFLKIAGLPETTAAIAVGDVVGHGVAAAMLMATARGILRSRCREPASLADLLTHLNSLLVEDTGGDRFMTMLLMTADAERKELCWATAGHDLPIVYDPRTDQFCELNGSGMSLGLIKGIRYEEQCFTHVHSGQVILVSTDGLREAFNEDGEMFGKKRMCELVRRLANRSAMEIVERINEELMRFLGSKSPMDDLTFVVVKVL